MSDRVKTLLVEYRREIEKVLEHNLQRIILYGSYARGDYVKDSDIDIMILAKIKPEEISHFADRIYDLTYDFEMQYGIEINPSIQSFETYEKWKKASPFFMNIEKDGVAV